MKSIVGRKMGMTQVFAQDGTMYPVTVIEVLPNVVTQVKTMEKDGYNAIQVGYEDKKEVRCTKPELGQFKKANCSPKYVLKEIATDTQYNVGDEIKCDIFAANDVIDVVGTSKGRGFLGAIQRYGYTIGPKGHGSGAHRIVGSMGPIAPNRIAPGKKLPGQMGHVTRTIQNLEVVAVDPENNLLLIKGSVPGPKKGLVVVKTAIKKAGQVNPVHELVDYTPEEVEETVVEEAVEAAAAE